MVGSENLPLLINHLLCLPTPQQLLLEKIYTPHLYEDDMYHSVGYQVHTPRIWPYWYQKGKDMSVGGGWGEVANYTGCPGYIAFLHHYSYLWVEAVPGGWWGRC